MTLTIKPSLFYTLYSPSFCELRLYLNHAGIKPSPPGAFAKLIFKLGQRHEKTHLDGFPDAKNLTGASSDKTLEEIGKETAVIYQGKFEAQVEIDGKMIALVGIPDFMIKEPQGYVIRDCKLARHASEKEHPEIARQLQVYGLLFERLIGRKPLRLEVLKGDCTVESVDYAGMAAAQEYIADLLDIMFQPNEPYSPVGWSKCCGCGYSEYCMTRAQENRNVALVYDLDQGLARCLRNNGVCTIQDLVSGYDESSLSDLKRPWGAREQKVGKKAGGILMQAQAMLEKKERVLKKPELPVAQNYVMFDLEGLPPQLDELDKIYLWGMEVFGEKPGAFRPALAETGKDGDKKGWENFLKIAGDIIQEYGDIPFVHWAPYEKSKISTYVKRYGDINGIASKVLSLLVDLLPITRESVVIPEMSYSLKVVEKYVGFKRTQDEYGGDWSIAKYIEAVEADDEGKRRTLMDEILKYNEEDLQATWTVFEWLRRLILR